MVSNFGQRRAGLIVSQPFRASLPPSMRPRPPAFLSSARVWRLSRSPHHDLRHAHTWRQ
jgi:hypothetical protein